MTNQRDTMRAIKLQTDIAEEYGIMRKLYWSKNDPDAEANAKKGYEREFKAAEKRWLGFMAAKTRVPALPNI